MKDQLISAQRLDSLLSQFSRLGKIMVLGDVGVDKYTVGEVKRISPEAPVPVLEVVEEKYKLGLAANVSNNLTALGIPSALYGVVGEDTPAEIFFNLLHEADIDRRGIVTTSTRPTTMKERVATGVQQICRIDYEKVWPLDSSTEEELKHKILQDLPQFQAVIIEDYSKGVLSQGILADVITSCRQQEKLVAIDPGRGTNPEWYRGADLLKPNLKEARLMAQNFGLLSSDWREIAQFLAFKLEIPLIAITLGAEGVGLYGKDQQEVTFHIPTIPTEVYDVSGAGDTAISILTAALLSGASAVESAWMANSASGVVVGKKGTATATAQELKNYHQRMAQYWASLSG